MSNIVKKSIRQVIYDTLLKDIFHGRIHAGEKLLESDLAEKFHVSRTPIREALFQLENHGFVAHKKNIGAVVKKISATTVQETYDLVALLEGHATEIAVDKITQKDISYLKSLHNSMEEKIRSKDFSTYVSENAKFHGFFAKRSGNAILEKAISNLRNKIYRLAIEGQTLPLHIDEYLESHHDIIETVVLRKRGKAGNLMRSHVLDAKKYLLEIMERSQKSEF